MQKESAESIVCPNGDNALIVNSVDHPDNAILSITPYGSLSKSIYIDKESATMIVANLCRRFNLSVKLVNQRVDAVVTKE